MAGHRAGANLLSYHRQKAPRPNPRRHDLMTNTHPLRIEIAAPSRAYPVLVGAGTLQDLEAALNDAGIGASRFVVSSPTVWGFWGEAFHGALPEAAPDHRAGRGAPQDAGHRQPHLRRAAQGRRRPVHRPDHLRRRRHRRHGRLRGRHLHAGHRPRPRADDAAGAGRRGDRGQGGRQPAGGQEPGRRLLSAVNRRHRSGRARDAAPARIQGGPVRGAQVRRGVRPGAVRRGVRRDGAADPA